jgi:hypothetical protein
MLATIFQGMFLTFVLKFLTRILSTKGILSTKEHEGYSGLYSIHNKCYK